MVSGDLFVLWPNISTDSTCVKSFMNLPLDEADEGSLQGVCFGFSPSFFVPYIYSVHYVHDEYIHTS